jgi:hypothetical protein
VSDSLGPVLDAREVLREWAVTLARSGHRDPAGIAQMLGVLYDIDWAHEAPMEAVWYEGERPPDGLMVPEEFAELAQWALSPQAQIVIRSLREFTETDEPAASALLGTDEANLIPEGGDVMIYGNGGAGKTTLAIDLAFHLAAGRDWIGIPVPRARNVLLVENEGPRPLLRDKLERKRKRELWKDALGDRIHVYEEPWRQFTLATEWWRQGLARAITALRIDLLIAGPLTRIGMDEAGTLQQVREFTELVEDLRALCARPLTVATIHHENKAGAVSGAWEGSGDTLLHVRGAGNGHTIVVVQKARWSSLHSQTTMKLEWTAGEGFRLEGERDLLAELVALVADGKWRTAKEAAAPRKGDKGGVGADESAVRELFKEHPEHFERRTGDAAKALGRNPTANLWGKVSLASNSLNSPSEFHRGGAAGESGESPVGGLSPTDSPHLPGLEVSQPTDSAPLHRPNNNGREDGKP